MAAAASCAVLGVLLKLTDLGSGSPASPGAPVATTAQRTSADAPVGEPAEPGDDAGAPGAHGPAMPGPPIVGAGFHPDRPSAALAQRAQGAGERRRLRKARREALLRVKRAGRWATMVPDADGNPVPRAVVEHGTQFPTATPVEADDLAETLAGERGSVSFWFQPQWQAGNQDDASLVAIADGQLQLVKNVNYLRLEFTDAEGGTHAIGAPITDWEAGEWHQVGGSWDGNVFQLYLDGVLVGETTIDGMFFVPEKARMLLGSDFPQYRPIAPGVMGGLDVRNRPLSPDEAMHRFVAGGAAG